MNALDRRIGTVRDKLISKANITSEICYFKGILNDQYSDVIRTHQDEYQLKLKIIIINEDMRKYMKISYPKLGLPYNKENEKKPIHELEQHNEIDSEEEMGMYTERGTTDNNDHIPGCTWTPEKISGEDIDFSIDLLLDNSANLGEHRFNVPNIPEEFVKNQEFGRKYYEEFYHRLLKIFEEFSDYQIHSQKYRIEDMIFVKLICRDQLFVIKINTFEVFYKKSIRYIKKGKDVFIKATYYQINNVMIGLSYNESKSILHDLNPNYAFTHEWTKEYFNIDKNMQIDYSDFDLDYYLEEDDDWLNLEKSLDSIINNFQTYLNACHELLFTEFSIKQIKDDYQVIGKDFRKIKKNAYCLSFKVNITDLVLLALELKRFPPCEASTEELKQVDLNESTYTNKTTESDMTLTRFRSEKVPPTAGNVNTLTSPLLSKDLSVLATGQNAQDHTDYAAIEKQFSEVLEKDYNLECHRRYYFSHTNEKSKNAKKVDPLVFYSWEVMYVERSSAKRKNAHSYGGIFDRSLIKDFLVSVNYIKEQTTNKLPVNKSEGFIDPGVATSLTDILGMHDDSIENVSFDIKRIEDEEECENVSEANVILKFEFLPEDVGIILDESISVDEIVQDSQRYIIAKGFNINFLNIFQSNVDEIKSEQDIDDLNITTEEVDESVKERVESFVPTIVKLREGDHRNHILRLEGETRRVIKDKLIDVITFFITRKLDLLRFVRPMNAEIIKEVLRCMDQID